MRVTITPPDKALYDERVRAAVNCFKHADIMPPFLVTYMCFSVMYRALGGYTGILRYVLRQIYSDVRGDVRERLWWTWHLYIRCRSRGEIQELIDQNLEELTGDDHREWPDVITVEEAQQTQKEMQ
jgi:hypothetical protein